MVSILETAEQTVANNNTEAKSVIETNQAQTLELTTELEET